MKCPYAVHRKTVTECHMEYEEDSDRQTMYREVSTSVAEFCECQKENCGAWHNGRCNYNQS